MKSKVLLFSITLIAIHATHAKADSNADGKKLAFRIATESNPPVIVPISKDPQLPPPTVNDPLAIPSTGKDPSSPQHIVLDPPAPQPIANDPPALPPIAKDPPAPPPIAKDPPAPPPIAKDPPALPPIANDPPALPPIANDPQVPGSGGGGSVNRPIQNFPAISNEIPQINFYFRFFRAYTPSEKDTARLIQNSIELYRRIKRCRYDSSGKVVQENKDLVCPAMASDVQPKLSTLLSDIISLNNSLPSLADLRSRNGVAKPPHQILDPVAPSPDLVKNNGPTRQPASNPGSQPAVVPGPNIVMPFSPPPSEANTTYKEVGVAQ